MSSVVRCVVILVVVYGVLFSHRRHRPVFDDLEVYRVAGHSALAHRTVFDRAGHYQYKYSPFVAVLFGWSVSQLPASVAGPVCYAVSVLLWMLWFALLLVRGRPGRDAVADGALFLGLCFAVALRDELRLGQVNAIALLLLLGAFAGGGHGPRALWTGLCLALAIQFKLYCLFAVPALVFGRRGAVVGWAVFWSVMTLVVFQGLFHSFAFAGSELRAWGMSLTSSSSDLILRSHNVSIMGLVAKGAARLGADPASCRAVGLAVLAPCMALFVWGQFRVRHRQRAVGYALASAAIVPLTPIAWPYWVVASAPLMLLLFRARGGWSAFRGVVGAASLVALLWASNGLRSPTAYALGACTWMVVLAITYAVLRPGATGVAPAERATRSDSGAT